KVEAVEILKVWAPSPPVPTMSMKCGPPSTSTWRANSRITEAAAVISPMLSFLIRRPARIAAVMTGDTSPAMIRRIRESISSWKISRCSMQRVSASCGVMADALGSVVGELVGMLALVLVDVVCRRRSGRLGDARHGAFEKSAKHGVAVLGRDRLGVELHAFDVEVAVPDAHDLAVVGPGGELQAVGQGCALDRERMVTNHLEGGRQVGEDARALVVDGIGLAVHHARGAHHAA